MKLKIYVKSILFVSIPFLIGGVFALWQHGFFSLGTFMTPEQQIEMGHRTIKLMERTAKDTMERFAAVEQEDQPFDASKGMPERDEDGKMPSAVDLLLDKGELPGPLTDDMNPVQAGTREPPDESLGSTPFPSDTSQDSETSVHESTVPIPSVSYADNAFMITQMGKDWTAAFTLTDHNNKKVDQTYWPQKNLVIFFSYTHSPKMGVAVMKKLTAVFTTGVSLLQGWKPMLVTVDPDRDTPAVLKAFLKPHHPALIGLTGTQEQIDSMVKAFQTYVKKEYAEDKKTYTISHMPFLYLVSQDRSKMVQINANLPPHEILKELKQYQSVWAVK